ncbi:MAG: hypothetical protein DRP65_09290 [Planctomycetota bacterium]|nr:MAG: hypothetical protein DRP65_09290 [Planctomycetota bacterium]
MRRSQPKALPLQQASGPPVANRRSRKKMVHIPKNKSCRGHQIGVFIGIEFVAPAVTSEFTIS